jgi:putative endonuclease
MANFYLFILSSRHHRYLSIGVTADLSSGITGQRILVNRRLKKKRVLQKLVYVESLNSVDDAVQRELKLKKASRRQINRLVESVNPGWDSISLSELVSAGFDRRC